MSFPKVSFIILNWNGWKDTIECLESLYQSNYLNYEVILIDNNSEDGSIEHIKKYCEGKIKVTSDFFEYEHKNKPLKVFEYSQSNLNKFKNDKADFFQLSSNKKLILIKNEKNYGFAEGNNIGIDFIMNHLDSPYIMLLNNDIILDPQFVNELVEVGEENLDIGILGSINCYYDKPEIIQTIGSKLNLWTGGFNSLYKNINVNSANNGKIEVDFVIGTAFMIKKSVIEKIGMFYTPYFAYWEEIDFCTKAKNNEFKICSVLNSKIWHKQSSSLSLYNKKRTYLILRNNILFMRRNASYFQFISFSLFFFIFRVPSFFLSMIINNNKKEFFSITKTISKAVIDGFNYKMVDP